MFFHLKINDFLRSIISFTKHRTCLYFKFNYLLFNTPVSIITIIISYLFKKKPPTLQL